jgi:hypothetical protein
LSQSVHQGIYYTTFWVHSGHDQPGLVPRRQAGHHDLLSVNTIGISASAEFYLLLSNFPANGRTRMITKGFKGDIAVIVLPP